MIKNKGIQIAHTLKLTDFKGSNGWLNNFLLRNKLVLRRITTTGRKLSEDSAGVINEFFDLCNRKLRNIDHEQIYAADETNFRLDAPPNYTYETRGTQRVGAITSGKEKAKVSVMACATAIGVKLPLVIVVPRKTPLPRFRAPDNVIVVYKTSGTFDSTLIVDGFLKRFNFNSFVFLILIWLIFFRVIDAHVLRSGFNNPALIWDNATCHSSAEVEEHLLKTKIVPIFVPPRMTGLLQPADVCWFRSFKLAFRRKYMNWCVNEPKTFTQYGNMRSPGYVALITWLSEIWQNFDDQLICESFDTCGITSQTGISSILKKIMDGETVTGEVVTSDDEPEIEVDL
jgi:hypothetical protein